MTSKNPSDSKAIYFYSSVASRLTFNQLTYMKVPAHGVLPVDAEKVHVRIPEWRTQF